VVQGNSKADLRGGDKLNYECPLLFAVRCFNDLSRDPPANLG